MFQITRQKAVFARIIVPFLGLSGRVAMSFYVNAVGARVKARTNGQRLEPPRQPDRADPIEKRLAPIPQPFRDMLASMHNHEPQVGTDGAIHASDNVSGVTVDDGLYLYNLC